MTEDDFTTSSMTIPPSHHRLVVLFRRPPRCPQMMRMQHVKHTPSAGAAADASLPVIAGKAELCSLYGAMADTERCRNGVGG